MVAPLEFVWKSGTTKADFPVLFLLVCPAAIFYQGRGDMSRVVHNKRGAAISKHFLHLAADSCYIRKAHEWRVHSRATRNLKNENKKGSSIKRVSVFKYMVSVKEEVRPDQTNLKPPRFPTLQWFSSSTKDNCNQKQPVSQNGSIPDVWDPNTALQDLIQLTFV